MVNFKLKPIKVVFNPNRKSQTLPNQALSISEIMKRYVRNIPVDVKQREAVYVDQNDYDLEKLNRMDLMDKADFAADLRIQTEQRAKDIKDEKAERERIRLNEQAAKENKAEGDKPPQA